MIYLPLLFGLLTFVVVLGVCYAFDHEDGIDSTGAFSGLFAGAILGVIVFTLVTLDVQDNKLDGVMAVSK